MDARRRTRCEELAKLPIKALEALLSSSPDGLSKSEAQTRLEKYAYKRVYREKEQRHIEIPFLFLGPDPIHDYHCGGFIRQCCAIGLNLGVIIIYYY